MGWQLPHLRNDVGAGQSDGGTGREPRTDGHDPAILDRARSNVAGIRPRNGGHIAVLGMHDLVPTRVSTWIPFALSTPVVL
jgi:hypothetical protein